MFAVLSIPRTSQFFYVLSSTTLLVHSFQFNFQNVSYIYKEIFIDKFKRKKEKKKEKYE